MQSEPLITLKIYPFGVLMRRNTPQGISEYLIDPAQLAMQLASNIRLETGLLSPNTIYVAQEGVHKIVVEHRPRKKTAIFLEGSEAAVVIPLPDLLMLRRASDKGGPDYRIFAVKERPTDLKAALYHAPLPNLYDDGRVCWGSVRRENLSGATLEEDWRILLGTPFGSHNCARRSKEFPDDVRKKYLDMERRKSRVYSKRDLLPAKRILEDVLEELRR